MAARLAVLRPALGQKHYRGLSGTECVRIAIVTLAGSFHIFVNTMNGPSIIRSRLQFFFFYSFIVNQNMGKFRPNFSHCHCSDLVISLRFVYKY